MFQAGEATAAKRHLCAIMVGLSSPSHCVRQVAKGVDMTLIDLGLWIVLAALFALVPFGCIMTRSRKVDAPDGGKSP